MHDDHQPVNDRSHQLVSDSRMKLVLLHKRLQRKPIAHMHTWSDERLALLQNMAHSVVQNLVQIRIQNVAEYAPFDRTRDVKVFNDGEQTLQNKRLV